MAAAAGYDVAATAATTAATAWEQSPAVDSATTATASSAMASATSCAVRPSVDTATAASAATTTTCPTVASARNADLDEGQDWNHKEFFSAQRHLHGN